MKKAAAVVLIFVMLISLVGCRFSYGGEHEDLYTVGVYNIFGSTGYRSNGEVHFDPDIEVVETDSYGRVLFFYDEGAYNPLGCALVVMQKAVAGFVYYYQDICHIPYVSADRRADVVYSEVFTAGQIEALKEVNDWEKPFNAEKCTRTAVVDRKQQGTLGLEEEDFEKYIQEYAKTVGYKGDDNIFRYFEYVNTDKYGREIYYVYGVGRDVKGEGVSPSSEHQYFTLAMIFNPDKTCPISNICEVTEDAANYERVKKLKLDCGWDEPWEE